MYNKNIKKCPCCGEVKELTSNGYCFECRKDYLKNWYNNNKGYYLYIILNNNKVEYVGATENITNRMYSHITGYSKNTEKLILSNNWTCIKYLDITNLVTNREEMLLLENSLIELYNTEYNDKKNIIKNVDKFREFELLAEVHSLNQKWVIYAENEHKKMLL